MMGLTEELCTWASLDTSLYTSSTCWPTGMMNTQIAANTVQVLQKDNQPEKAGKKSLNYLSIQRISSGHMVFSKIVNFDRIEAGLTSKWGRISPADQWCYQNQFNCTVRRRTTSRDIAKKFVTRQAGRQAGRRQYGLYSEVALAKKL